MLVGKGFSEVINMSGGMKAWNGDTAFGSEDAGIALFSGKEEVEEVLLIAYALEAGLQGFYTLMQEQVTQEKVKALFSRLGMIEEKHQDQIFSEYRAVTSDALSREAFERNAAVQSMEGGLTTEEYLSLYPTNFEVVGEVISLVMGIEAQALDLYLRAAENCSRVATKETLFRIGEEERAHLKLLGDLLDETA
ncbi:Rubrerythrin [Candidatus Electrothrix laxa]